MYPSGRRNDCQRGEFDPLGVHFPHLRDKFGAHVLLSKEAMMAAVARRSGQAPDVMKSCTCLQQVEVSIFCCVCSFTSVGLRAFGRTLTLGPASMSNVEVGFAANMLPQTVLYKK